MRGGNGMTSRWTLLIAGGMTAALLGVARADSATLQDVALELGGSTYRMAAVTFTDANLKEAQLRALFDKGDKEPLDRRLARLSAASVTIPELVIVTPM